MQHYENNYLYLNDISNVNSIKFQMYLEHALIMWHFRFSWMKSKAIPLWAWAGPKGFRMLRLPYFKTISI